MHLTVVSFVQFKLWCVQVGPQTGGMQPHAEQRRVGLNGLSEQKVWQVQDCIPQGP